MINRETLITLLNWATECESCNPMSHDECSKCTALGLEVAKYLHETGGVMENRQHIDTLNGVSLHMLTRRELFAAMAMQGMLAHNDDDHETVAHWSVKQADALIAELDKEVNG